jgi:D-aminopeptidase
VTPEASCELIQAAVTKALHRLSDFKPFTVKHPVALDITFKSYLPSEVLSYLRILERPDAHSIRFRAQDMAEAADFMEFLEEYNISLEP